MTPTFIDASFWIALRAREEPEHEAARDLGRRLAAERAPLIATDLVFAEVHAYFSRMRRLREQVIADFWDSRVVRLVDSTLADKQKAIVILRQNEDKTYSFCDAVSFVIMQRLHLKRVAAYDDHFRQFGGLEVVG